jgi:RimJ/RimL family protein N-acetyltransferase
VLETRPRITVRPATAADADQLLAWRNEPAARRASLDDAVITPEVHVRWLARRLAEPAAAIFVVVDADGEDIGYVRFEPAPGESHVSIALAPHARGAGRGPAALRAAVEAFRRRGRREPVVALIRPDNPVSRVAFSRAGFTPAPPRTAGSLAVDVLVRSDG